VSGATWSPNTATWGGNNRTHMIRIPGPGRVEYRLADGSANPYLLQAALLAAGIDGLAQKRDPGKRLDVNMYEVGHTIDGVRRLPMNLLDAIRAFEECAPLRAALGDSFVASYAKLKYQQWDSYMRHLSVWERDNTLDC
jgi:glutamate---methylamine ligase